MRGDDVAAEKARDLPLVVERDVHQEIDRQRRTVLPDLLLRRVARQHTPLALRMADHLGAVIVQDRGQVGHTGECGLVASRKAGHEVRLDKTDEDAPVRLHVFTVHHQRAAPVPPRPRHRQRIFIIGVVVDHPQPPVERRANDPCQLLSRVAAVRPRARDNGNVLLRHMRQLGQDPRQEPIGGQGAGAVGDDDRNAFVRAHRFGQRPRLLGRAHRFPERGLLVRQPFDKARANDGGVFGRQLGFQPVAAVLEMDLHLRYPFDCSGQWPVASGP